MKRRQFAKLATLAGLSSSLPKNAFGTSVRVRTEWSVAGPVVQQTFIDAVRFFKSLPVTDPRNWTFLARIHLNMCSHGNWFFFPWHRPFVIHLEKMIQNESGNPDFALPYWNWTSRPTIPLEFLAPVSPLYDAARTRHRGQPMPNGFADSRTMARIMATRDFNLFAGARTIDQFVLAGYGAVEATPHNCIHNWLAGDMANFMSPLDPLFWVHHSNIDRLWLVWNQTNRNTTDPAWSNYQLQYGRFTWKVSDTLNTLTMGYTYDRNASV